MPSEFVTLEASLWILVSFPNDCKDSAVPSRTVSLFVSVTQTAGHGNSKQRKMRIDTFAVIL